MGIIATLSSWVNVILDPILSPLLKLGPLWAVIILSFFIALFINIVTKLVTDQNKMKALKEDMKSFQKRAKEIKDTEKRMEVQKQAMNKNFEYMKHSFRSTFVTLIPLLLIFGWMQLHLGYVPIYADAPFDVSMQFNDGITGSATIEAPNLELIPSNVNATIEQEKEKNIVDGKVGWKLKGDPGDYIVSYAFMNKTYTNEVSINEPGKFGYKVPDTAVRDGIVKNINVGLEKIYIIELFGLRLTWFWSYVILSIAISLALRKVMGVY